MLVLHLVRFNCASGRSLPELLLELYRKGKMPTPLRAAERTVPEADARSVADIRGIRIA